MYIFTMQGQTEALSRLCGVGITLCMKQLTQSKTATRSAAPPQSIILHSLSVDRPLALFHGAKCKTHTMIMVQYKNAVVPVNRLSIWEEST